MTYTTASNRHAPIGVMDSGFGGLSILRELHSLLPYENFVFFGDQAHIPYGEKTLTQVCEYVSGITRFFLSNHEDVFPVKLMVIACNTASAAALHNARKKFPELQFVGIEPAVKPAAERTQTGKIGVIATRATFQGELYESLVDRFAQDVEVYKRACPEFVTLVERGGPYTVEDQTLIHNVLQPLVDQNIDQLVLGCTHFPFLTTLIQQNFESHGLSIEIIDPSPAVARQTKRLLKANDALIDSTIQGKTTYITSGNTSHFRKNITELLGIENPNVYAATWQDSQLMLTENHHA